MLQVNYNEDLRIANVLYYFYIRFGDDRYPLAMVSLFSKPDPEILLESSGAVHLCDQITGCGGVAVIPITAVHSVVAMIPEMRVEPSGQITLTGKFSLMRHAYLEVARFANDVLSEEDEERDDDFAS